MVVECCGIAHAFVSMYALGLDHSFEAAAIAYTVSVVLMIVSPFLRGLGAVELTMLYILKRTATRRQKDWALQFSIGHSNFGFHYSWESLPLHGVVSNCWHALDRRCLYFS
jgi:hypothetical protein